MTDQRRSEGLNGEGNERGDEYIGTDMKQNMRVKYVLSSGAIGAHIAYCHNGLTKLPVKFFLS